LLSRIKPAIPATKFEGDKSSKNPAYVNAVARRNAELTVDNIRRRSPVLADLEKKRFIKITSAMYDIAPGAAD
jgi:carbonic anhydrase